MTTEHAAAALLPQHASDAVYNDAIPATQERAGSRNNAVPDPNFYAPLTCTPV